MRRSAAVALALVLCVAQWTTIHAGFFVCPAPCQAKLLPRDMESLEDCLCNGDVSPLLDNNNGRTGAYRCPDGASAKRLHPMSFSDCVCLSGFTRDDMRKSCSSDTFQCRGRYKTQDGVTSPASIADCDCQRPYKKDDATGQCVLRKCPRAGNYVKKSTSRSVTSLADCTCIDPMVKNDQSGECLVDTPFDCPAFSQPVAGRSRARSFEDCECEWGFVRTPQDTCERESVAYVCPKYSIKKASLGLGERARSFADCECDREFKRNTKLHKCERIEPDVDGDGTDELDADDGFACPPMARPLAPVAYSIEQCECLPGYGWKTPEMTCVRLSGYVCPPHAFKSDPNKHIEERFSDCECARGYYRDDAGGACLEWFLANDNGCPKYAFLRHWPLQSKANCQCIYGLVSDSASEKPSESDTEEDDEEEDLPATNTPAKLRQQKRNKAQCEGPPPEYLGKIRFSQCPENAIAINWPVQTSDDCLCKDGFTLELLGEDGVERGDGASFMCVDVKEAITTDEDAPPSVPCKPPQVKSPFTGECRLPVEQVRPRGKQRKTKDGVATVATRGEVLFKGIEYDYVLTEDDVLVIQGDVAIGELVTWAPPTGEDPVAKAAPPPTPVLHGYYNSERDHRWQDATMCFQVEDSASAFRPLVDEAMDHITAVTNFKFRACRGNDCHADATCAHDFVSIKKTLSSCYSYVGRIGGKQLLGVSAECGLGNLVHVLLHAVGLHHTIDRADRDDHVRVAWECVPETQRANFVIEDLNVTTDADADSPYDFFSIMHHPADAFVRMSGLRNRNEMPPWCQSVLPIIALPEERVAVMARMGQRLLMAVTDIHAVWRLYPSLASKGKPPTYESVAAKGDDQAVVHESRLHTQDDVVATDASLTKKTTGKSWARKISSFIGAMVTLVGFALFVAFAVVELRRRAWLLGGNGGGNGGYYTESLLADKAMYD